MKNAEKLHKIAAMVYCGSMWTLVGWLAFNHFTGSGGQKVQDTQHFKKLEDDPRVRVYETKNFKMVVVHKDESVRINPYIAKFLRWIGGREV